MSWNHNRYAVAILLLLVSVIGFAACSKSGSPTAPVSSGGGGAGGTSFNLGPFAIGQSATFTFATAGTFGYHCIPHQSMGMVGTVQVDAGGADSTVVQIGASGFTFEPALAHIKAGGYVRWINASGLTNHTVTSN